MRTGTTRSTAWWSIGWSVLWPKRCGSTASTPRTGGRTTPSTGTRRCALPCFRDSLRNSTTVLLANLPGGGPGHRFLIVPAACTLWPSWSVSPAPVRSRQTGKLWKTARERSEMTVRGPSRRTVPQKQPPDGTAKPGQHVRAGQFAVLCDHLNGAQGPMDADDPRRRVDDPDQAGFRPPGSPRPSHARRTRRPRVRQPRRRGPAQRASRRWGCRCSGFVLRPRTRRRAPGRRPARAAG